MIPPEQLGGIGAHLAETPVVVDNAEHHSAWIEGQRSGNRALFLEAGLQILKVYRNAGL